MKVAESVKALLKLNILITKKRGSLKGASFNVKSDIYYFNEEERVNFRRKIMETKKPMTEEEEKQFLIQMGKKIGFSIIKRTLLTALTTVLVVRVGVFIVIRN